MVRKHLPKVARPKGVGNTIQQKRVQITFPLRFIKAEARSVVSRAAQVLNLRFKRSQVAFSAVPQSRIQTWDLVGQASKISRRVSHSMGNFNDP